MMSDLFFSRIRARGAAAARVAGYWRVRYCGAVSHTHCDGGCGEKIAVKSQEDPLASVLQAASQKPEVHKRGKLVRGKESKDDLGRHGHVLAVPVEPVNIQLVRG